MSNSKPKCEIYIGIDVSKKTLMSISLNTINTFSFHKLKQVYPSWLKSLDLLIQLL